MTLAVASGKGGTGKTTVAVSLALTLEGPVQLLDCDVEEPNAHLFLEPRWESQRSVSVPIPEVEEGLCTACGACGRACQFHAIVSLKTQPLVFPELCHGCGACTLACPEGAIREVPREVGVVQSGARGSIRLVHGLLKVGEPMAGPLIRAVKRTGGESWGEAEVGPGGATGKSRQGAVRRFPTIIDAPPGTSCSVVAAVRGSDFVLLVTEPTPFGLNDLKLAVSMLRTLALPFGVAINRSDIGDEAVRDYCAAEGIPVLLEIPEDRRVAEAYSRGEPAVSALPELRPAFRELYRRLERALATPVRPGRGRDTARGR
jgi:MinD superfamily P-loop ATPase